MAESRLTDYLLHIAEAAGQIGIYLEGFEKSDFLADKRTQQAVVLKLIVIGEAATRLISEHETFIDRYTDVPWRSMRGMRNRIAHGYFDIDLDVVWETTRSSLPAIREGLVVLIAEENERRETD